MSDVYQSLSEPFPQEMVKRLNKGGANLTYIPISEVINRMNKVIGVENWSFNVKTWQQVGTSIVAHVIVHAKINDTMVSRDGVGGQKIKMSKQGDPIDIGDEVKGAVSDALKKAVQTLGIGLYLARSEEAIEIEQVMDAYISPVPQSAPAQSEKYTQFKSLIDGLPAEGKQHIKNFWNDFSGGRKTPKPNEFTDSELDALITECIAFSFNGSSVVAEKEAVSAPARRDLE
jgi:hypothetical protein